MPLREETRPEFSRLLGSRRLAALPLREKISALPAECEALASRFGLEGLEGLEATVDVNALRGRNCLSVKGKFKAVAYQRCVVSLDVVPSSVEDAFEVVFALDDNAFQDADDDPLGATLELMDDESIDIGELVAQHLILGLDAFPRAEVVTSDRKYKAGDNFAEEEKISPFAVLEQLRQRS